MAFMELDEELAKLIGGPQHRKSSILHGRSRTCNLTGKLVEPLGLESFPTLLADEETTATTHRSAAALSLLGRG